jgi:hypothetical protein
MDRIGELIEKYEGRWPHVTYKTIIFWDKKMRFVFYVFAYSLDHAKEIIKAFDSEGMRATAIKKYDRRPSKNRKHDDITKPVFVVFFSKSKVLYNLHRSWYENGRQLWPKL